MVPDRGLVARRLVARAGRGVLASISLPVVSCISGFLGCAVMGLVPRHRFQLSPRFPGTFLV